MSVGPRREPSGGERAGLAGPPRRDLRPHPRSCGGASDLSVFCSVTRLRRPRALGCEAPFVWPAPFPQRIPFASPLAVPGKEKAGHTHLRPRLARPSAEPGAVHAAGRSFASEPSGRALGAHPADAPGSPTRLPTPGAASAFTGVGSGQRSTPRATLGTRPAPAVATGREHPCRLMVWRSEPRVGLTGGEPSGQGWLLLEACGGLSPLPLPGPAPRLALSRPHPVTPRPPRGQAPSLGGGPGALVPLAALAPRC